MAEMVTFNEETILAQGEVIYSRRAEIEAMADAVTEKGFSGILISSSGGSQAMLAPFSAMIDELSEHPLALRPLRRARAHRLQHGGREDPCSHDQQVRRHH